MKQLWLNRINSGVDIKIYPDEILKLSLSEDDRLNLPVDVEVEQLNAILNACADEYHLLATDSAKKREGELNDLLTLLTLVEKNTTQPTDMLECHSDSPLSKKTGGGLNCTVSDALHHYNPCFPQSDIERSAVIRDLREVRALISLRLQEG